MKDRKLLLANAVTKFVRRSMINRNAQDVVNQILADDAANTGGDEGNDRGKLKVLNDGDGVRLLMDIYQSYVSDDDYVEFPNFMHNVDTLLYRARGNRTLTREEREEMEDAAPKKGKGRGSRRPKPAPAPAPVSENNNTESTNEVTSSDMSPVGNFFTRYLQEKVH